MSPFVLALVGSALTGWLAYALGRPSAHRWMATGMYALIGLHILGAAYHGLWLRDGVVRRVLR